MGCTPWSEDLVGHLVTRQDTVTEGVSWVNHEDSEPEDIKRSECGVGLGEELASGHVSSLARQGPMGSSLHAGVLQMVRSREWCWLGCVLGHGVGRERAGRRLLQWIKPSCTHEPPSISTVWVSSIYKKKSLAGAPACVVLLLWAWGSPRKGQQNKLSTSSSHENEQKDSPEAPNRFGDLLLGLNSLRSCCLPVVPS